LNKLIITVNNSCVINTLMRIYILSKAEVKEMSKNKRNEPQVTDNCPNNKKDQAPQDKAPQSSK